MKDCLLNNGNQMPMVGFGTLQIKDEKQCKECVYEAIRMGYRMIDTSPAYFNEEAIGEGIHQAIEEVIVKREDLFITTKLWISDAEDGKVFDAIEKSLMKLKLEYIDLYLIHHPYGNYVSAWKQMEDLVNIGIIKNIGVCNFHIKQLEEILDVCSIVPAVNQIEIHPYYLHRNLLEYMKQYQITPVAWAPLFEGQGDIFQNETLLTIAEKYHKTTAQVILRWHYEKGVPTIPKTVHPCYMKENIEICDFELSEEDKQQIESLDLGYSQIVDYENPMTEKWLRGIQI